MFGNYYPKCITCNMSRKCNIPGDILCSIYGLARVDMSLHCSLSIRYSFNSFYIISSTYSTVGRWLSDSNLCRIILRKFYREDENVRILRLKRNHCSRKCIFLDSKVHSSCRVIRTTLTI